MKKFSKILVILLVLLSLTGCTKYVKDGKKSVQTDKGLNLVDNILCKPKDKKTLAKYEENKKNTKTKIDKLPECKNFKVTQGGYTGIWESLFVKPIAWVILKLGYLIHNFGLAIMILGLAIRLLMLPLSIKSMKQSEAMKKIQPKLQKIEKKYADKTDQESLMMKSQETMALYKEYNVSPIAGCLTSFIQLPIFFAFLEAIYRLPAVFEGKFLYVFDLGMTPLKGITSHNYFYIIIIALVILSTYVSFKNTMSQANTMPEAEKSMALMSKLMIIMIAIASINFSTAISLYWIVTNIFVLFQNLLMKKLKK